MKYNFDKVIDSENIGSIKWKNSAGNGSQSDDNNQMIPLRRADMDFQIADSETAKTKIRGILPVTVGSIIISFSPVFVKISDVEPTMAGFYRTLFGGIALVIVVLFKKKRFRLNALQFKLAFASAFFFSLGLSFWHRSIHAIGPGISTILANFQVFFVALIALLFLKERISLRVAISIFIAMAGVCLLVGFDRIGADVDFRIGAVFGFSAAFVYACFLMAIRKLQSNLPLSNQLVNFTFVSLFCAMIMGMEGWLQGETFIIPNVQNLFLMIVYGVICQALGWILISFGLPHVAASRAGLILLLQPTGAFIWDVLFFNRATSLIEFFGACIVLGAIYLGSTKQH